MADLDLDQRNGLPEALQVLLDAYPRDGWTQDPGFDGLIRFWLDRHMMFRRLMDGMKNSTDQFLDRKMDVQQFAGSVSRYGGMFVNGLHEHHTIEDTYYFPKLQQKDDRLVRGFDVLDSDHHKLDEYLAGFVDSANTLLGRLDDRNVMQDNAGDFQAQLVLLERLLDRHLVDEEDLIVPVILKFGSDGLGG